MAVAMICMCVCELVVVVVVVVIRVPFLNISHFTIWTNFKCMPIPWWNIVSFWWAHKHTHNTYICLSATNPGNRMKNSQKLEKQNDEKKEAFIRIASCFPSVIPALCFQKENIWIHTVIFYTFLWCIVCICAHTVCVYVTAVYNTMLNLRHLWLWLTLIFGSLAFLRFVLFSVRVHVRVQCEWISLLFFFHFNEIG